MSIINPKTVRGATRDATQDIAELPYDSPQDQPDVMLITANELELILERHFQPVQDDAATFCIESLAEMLCQKSIRMCDGTETWDGDVQGTLYNILVDAGVVNPDTNAVISNSAFRRGTHAAVQAIVDNFSDLVQRRNEAHAPQQLTELIKAMALRIAGMTFPSEDPGPATTETPDTPADPRPTTETLLAIAALAAEESGCNIRLSITSDGVQVIGRRPGQIRDAIRAATWPEIVTSPDPILSHRVAEVIEELSR